MRYRGLITRSGAALRALAILAAASVLISGCGKSTSGSKKEAVRTVGIPEETAGGPAPPLETPGSPAPPLWVDQLGVWVEKWERSHPDETGQYEWVVGTSQAMESRAKDALAGQIASQNAIFHLMRILGMDIQTEAKTTETWTTTPGGRVASDLYRKALTQEMAKHRVNFKEWSRFQLEEEISEGGYTRTVYILKVLYRLNKAKFIEDNTLGAALARFEKLLSADTKLSAAERSQALGFAKRLVERGEAKMKALARERRSVAATSPDIAGGTRPSSYGRRRAKPGDIEWAIPRVPPLWFVDFAAWRETWVKKHPDESDGVFRVVTADGSTESDARQSVLDAGVRAFSLPASEKDMIVEVGTYLRKWLPGRRDGDPYEISALYRLRREKLVWARPKKAPLWFTDYAAWLRDHPEMKKAELRVATAQGATESEAEEAALGKGCKYFGRDPSEKDVLTELGRYTRKWSRRNAPFEVSVLVKADTGGKRWLVVVATRVDRRPSDSEAVANALGEALAAAKYEAVVQPPAGWGAVAKAPALKKLAAEKKTARILVGKVDCRFSQKTALGPSYKATVNLRVLNAKTGSAVWSGNLPFPEKGFDPTSNSRETAASNAINNAARAAADVLAKALEAKKIR